MPKRTAAIATVMVSLAGSALVGSVLPVHAASGDPVSGFGKKGVTTTRFGTGQADDHAVGVVRQSDGKLVLVSQQSNYVTVGSIDLLRLRSDGSVDSSFGIDGRRSLSVKPSLELEAVALQGDRILVAGSTIGFGPNGSDLFVARFNRDGTPDKSFSGDGRTRIDLAENDFARAVSAGPNGTVLLAGQSDSDAVTLRLTASGALDATYAVGGVRSLATSGSSTLPIDLDMHTTAAGVVTLAFSDVNQTRVARLTPSGALDGSFGGGDVSFSLLVGEEIHDQVTRWGDRTYVVVGDGGRYRVLALDENGTFDNAFSGDGREVIATSADTVIPTDVSVGFDGSLVVTGVHDAADGKRWSVTRIKSTGGLDTTFAGTGEIDRRFDGRDGAAGVLARAGGYIVVGVRQTDLAALALRSNGTTDTSFGVNGVRQVNTSRSSSSLEGSYVTTAPKGRFLVAGTVTTGSRGATRRFVILRYRSDGRLDTTFSRDGIVTADIVGRDDRLDGVRQLKDGKILAWGSSMSATSTSAVVLRFTESGKVDKTFGTNGRREFTSYESVPASSMIRLDVDSEDRIVLAHAYDAGGTTGTLVRRLRADGSDDPTFGASGRRLIPSVPAVAPSFLRLRNGRPYVLILGDQHLVRLTPGGALDGSFGPGGVRTLTLDQDYAFGRGLIMSDGRVVAIRTLDLLGAEVARLRTDGTPDPTFSDNGLVTVGNIGSPLNAVDQVTVSGNGTVLIGGYGVDDLSAEGFNGARSHVTRITPSGEVDTTFSGDGRAIAQASPGYYEVSAGLTLATNGDPVLAVVSVSPSLTLHLIRFQN